MIGACSLMMLSVLAASATFGVLTWMKMGLYHLSGFKRFIVDYGWIPVPVSILIIGAVTSFTPLGRDYVHSCSITDTKAVACILDKEVDNEEV